MTTLWGGFAEKALAKEHQVLPIADGLDDEIASAIGITCGTSYHALKDRAGLRRGETLLVLGAAGGVGIRLIRRCARPRGRTLRGSHPQHDEGQEAEIAHTPGQTKEQLSRVAITLHASESSRVRHVNVEVLLGHRCRPTRFRKAPVHHFAFLSEEL